MGVYALKPRFQAGLQGIAVGLAGRRVHPDALTLAAVGVSALGAGLLTLAADDLHWLWAVPIVAIVRLALNALDGLVAHATGTARPWGAVLNELGDRCSDVLLLAALTFSTGRIWLGLLTIIVVLLSSHAGVLAAAAGARREYGGAMGKADRMLVLGAAAAFTAATGIRATLDVGLAVIAAGSALTLVQRLWRTKRVLESSC